MYSTDPGNIVKAFPGKVDYVDEEVETLKGEGIFFAGLMDMQSPYSLKNTFYRAMSDHF